MCLGGLMLKWPCFLIKCRYRVRVPKVNLYLIVFCVTEKIENEHNLYACIVVRKRTVVEVCTMYSEKRAQGHGHTLPAYELVAQS